ncbi:hypothetical protein JCM3775_005775 [Rhodotorula graminis]|uniref:Uncharacterized protein n=1 Tax=Rhodotorula graminis (strain WP1) TaxID=578459 RepID=A0A194S4H7_RHOGW|nr:uncharacterized protein RHOBADRAFT_52683 [Rhodotorula graminis WP1]KPV75638.1 hypothetical protein RHOBADRAFT_52683 [Rhodotorula graminis WP1]
MARGKGGTPRRNQAHLDDDYSPTSPSPSSNTNSPSRRTASTTPGPAGSPARLNSPGPATAAPGLPAKPERGPTPLTAETTYHSRTRQLLVEHRKLRRQWNELIIRGLVGRTKAALELWVDVELALKAIDKQAKGDKVTSAVRAGYLFAQSAKLSDQVAAVEAVFASLTEVTQGMALLVDRAEYLVVEAAKTRGTLFAFREPLWVTWPLSRFADGVAALSKPYADSLALIRAQLDVLLLFPELPSSTPSTAASPSSDDRPSAERTRRRPTNEQLQAALSLLAVQPLLPGKASDAGAEAWEEVLAVEVGGWER